MNPTQAIDNSSQRHIGWWLVLCCVMVTLMVAVGGLTRLTESGLSIVEWKPISGTLPPLSESSWQAEFTAYKAYPQYEKTFKNMTLEEFKGIFWLEYLHRLLGRITGLVFLLPFAWFLIRKQLPTRRALTLGGIFLLGGLQGLMGWYMVKSGLIDQPWVSPYRLTAHLLLAFLLFGLLYWQALTSLLPHTRRTLLGQGFLTAMLIALIAQVALGGFVAGNDAGMIYNTYPLMDGQLMPPEVTHKPLMTNHAFVNFTHRWLAIGVVILTVFAYLRSRHCWKNASLRITHELLLTGVLIQAALGIATLLLIVPTGLAVLHQLTALLVFGIGLTALYSALHRAEV